MKYTQNTKRLTVQRTDEANRRGKIIGDKDTELRRSLAASSLGRNVDRPVAPSAPTHQEYKHDSEAYKRREDPTATVLALVKKGGLLNGVRIG